MMLKTIAVKNYKSLGCTGELFFNLPDKTSYSSGLTVLVGENNSGKSALISSFLKLKNNELINDEDKFQGKDVSFIFSDELNNKIEIKNYPDDARLKRSKLSDVDESSLSSDHFDVVKANRIWNANVGNPRLTDATYSYRNNFERQAIDSELASVLSSLKDNPDKLKEFNKILTEIIPGLGDWGTGRSRNTSYIKYKLNDGTQLSIDYALGDGILNLFRIVHSVIFDRIICIDEPEAFLHPRAQLALSRIFNKVSKNKQIILATHSPYILKNIDFYKAKILHFELIKGSSEIKEIKNTPNSFSAISYKVYGVNGEEYHNDLYNDLYGRSGCNNHTAFSNKLQKGNTFLDNIFDNTVPDSKQDKVVLPVFVRNCIHYPENKQDDFQEKLDESIVILEKIYGK